MILFSYLLRNVSSGLSTTCLNSCNHGLLKLSNSHGVRRGWAKEVAGVSLVEVGLLSLADIASANIQHRAQGQMR